MLENEKYRWIIPLLAWSLYLILLIPATRAIGSAATMTLIIPVSLTGATLGSRYGTITAVAGVGFNIIILLLLTDFSMISTLPFILGSFLTILVGFLAGKTRDMSDSLVEEVRRREKAEASLNKSKKRLQKLHRLTKDLQKTKSEEETYNRTYKILKTVIEADLTYFDILEDGKSVRDGNELEFENYASSRGPIEDISIDQHTEIKIGINGSNISEEEYIDMIKVVGLHLRESITRVRTEERIEFLHSMLRHDLNNKIQISKGYLQLLETVGMTEEQEDQVEKAIISLEQGMDIIEKVRKLSRVEEERIRKVNLNSVMRDMIEYYEPIAEKNNMDMESDLKRSKVDIKGGELLQEAFSNIISNSIIHSEGDQVKIFSEITQDEVICTIEDDGKGIEDKEKLFIQGYRRGKNAGTGLGTYLAKRIIDSCGGSIEVKDSALGGTRFDIYLKRV